MSKTALPKRKHPRLAIHDYSTPGAYFITICTHNRRCLFSRIVGRGLAPAENDIQPHFDVIYTNYGKIAKEELLLLEKRYPFLEIDQYVIMPNHIHAILVLKEEAAGASPRPTVMDIVCAYKSLTARKCNQLNPIGKLFQDSFYEHIIRNFDDYTEIKNYILQNPMHWHFDKLYSED